ACGTFTLRRDSLRGLPRRSGRRPRRLAIGHGNRTPSLFAQTFDITQPESNRAIGFDRAIPVGYLHVDRMKPDPAALRVFDERRRVIKAHRLLVDERRIER